MMRRTTCWARAGRCRCWCGWGLLPRRRTPRAATLHPFSSPDRTEMKPDFPPDVRMDAARLYFNLLKEIGIISQLSSNRLERLLPHGLTVSQFSVLGNLVRVKNPNSPSALAAAFQVTKGAMTNTLQKLEAAGFVTIEPDPLDGRGKVVSITAAGRRAQDDGIAATGPGLAGLFGVISLEEVKMVTPVLERVRKYLDENR
ncbi:MarR family transcriptional regulator [bacterium]|nr:MarR family transcriptional regulator [bacterium]